MYDMHPWRHPVKVIKAKHSSNLYRGLELVSPTLVRLIRPTLVRLISPTLLHLNQLILK